MNLLQSFLHNVVVHPLLFVADALNRLDVAPGVAQAIDDLHDLTAGAVDEEQAPSLADTEPPTPQPSPRTPATAALEYRPQRAPASEPQAPPPLTGSTRAKVQAARRSG